MALDIKKFFNDELPAALARNAEDAKTVGARYQISITGPTGGDWNVDVSASGPFCKPGTGPAGTRGRRSASQAGSVRGAARRACFAT